MAKKKKARPDRLAAGFLKRQEGKSLSLDDLQRAYRDHSRRIKSSRKPPSGS